MNPDRWQKIDQLLDAALELPVASRDSFLKGVCEGDESLRHEVESLLAAHEQSGSFIEKVAGGGLADRLAAIFDEHLHQAVSASAGSAPALVGRKLGHYQIGELLGAGGMGEVYRARDTRLDRNVAIKVLPEHLSSHPDALSRFEREAKAIASLSHPNILAIHDFGNQDGVTYAVMELLEGETLRTRLEGEPMNWREAAKITAAVADGLAAAHAKGIIHRDIKPENIFLTVDAVVKILDFGIARIKRSVLSNAETLISRGGGDTKPGTLMGTIGYMSPEQVRGEHADAPSDIFSLGCVLVEMLTGKRPFTRPSAAETMAAILRDPPLDAIQQEIPPDLDRIIHRCLEKSPEQRFQSARDLAFDLRSLPTGLSGAFGAASGASRAAAGEAVSLASPSLLHRWRGMWASRRVLGIALTILLAALAFLWWKSKREVGPPPNTLAVMPLINDSQDQGVEFLSDGITESIIANLAPLRPKLRVLANSSVTSYKGKTIDPRQAGRELQVRAILIGRVLQQGDLLLIRVELVDTADGTQLWNGHYQRRRADLMAIQEEISQQISETLRLNLTGAEKRLLAKRPTENSEAYYLYLNGRYFWNQRSDSALEKAIEFYQRAITLDPNYALAYAGMADAYALIYDGGPVRDQARRKATEFAQKASRLDNQLAEPHATLGFLATFRDHDWPEAEKNFTHAMELNRGYATAHHWYAIMLAIRGRFEAALEEINRAKEIDPRSFPINKDTGELFFYARRYDEAIAQLRRTIEAEPVNDQVPEAHYWIRNAYEQKGDFESAIEELQFSLTAQEVAELSQAVARSGRNGYWQKRLEFQSRRPGQNTPRGRMRMILANATAGNVDLAVTMIETMMNEDRHDGLAYMKVDARFDNLRSHPRFPDLLRRLNLSN